MFAWRYIMNSFRAIKAELCTNVHLNMNIVYPIMMFLYIYLSFNTGLHRLDCNNMHNILKVIQFSIDSQCYAFNLADIVRVKSGKGYK